MFCDMCKLVSLAEGGVMIMGKWSDERSVSALQEILCDSDGEQKVMSGEVDLYWA